MAWRERGRSLAAGETVGGAGMAMTGRRRLRATSGCAGAGQERSPEPAAGAGLSAAA